MPGALSQPSSLPDPAPVPELLRGGHRAAIWEVSVLNAPMPLGKQWPGNYRCQPCLGFPRSLLCGTLEMPWALGWPGQGCRWALDRAGQGCRSQLFLSAVEELPRGSEDLEWEGTEKELTEAPPLQKKNPRDQRGIPGSSKAALGPQQGLG